MLEFLSKMLLLDVLNGDKTEISYQSNYLAGKVELGNIGGGVVREDLLGRKVLLENAEN